MTIDINKIISWYTSRFGKITYSMYGSRNGNDGTADCSGAVTTALYYAGASKPSYLYSTMTLGGYLAANGFKRIVQNTDWNAKKGDCVLMSWGADMSQSGGAGGHVGFMVSDTQFISCDYWTAGQAGTAISQHDWNTYYANSNPTYIEVWRYSGTTPAPIPAKPQSYNDKFRAIGGGYSFEKTIFKADTVFAYAGVWQIGDYRTVDGKKADFSKSDNGLPLPMFTRCDGGDNNNVGVGAKLKMDAGWNTGTIDKYIDNAGANGYIGIKFGKYGMIYFDSKFAYEN